MGHLAPALYSEHDRPLVKIGHLVVSILSAEEAGIENLNQNDSLA